MGSRQKSLGNRTPIQWFVTNYRCFNGAEAKKPRKSPANQLYFFVIRCFNGAEAKKPRKYGKEYTSIKAQVIASMGPRQKSLGNLCAPPQLRIVYRSFNGAEAKKPRKCVSGYTTDARGYNASMGPRQKSLGNCGGGLGLI